jgi:hypothetical protein
MATAWSFEFRFFCSAAPQHDIEGHPPMISSNTIPPQVLDARLQKTVALVHQPPIGASRREGAVSIRNSRTRFAFLRVFLQKQI